MATETELERMVVRLVGDGVSYQKMLRDAQTASKQTAATVAQAGTVIEGVKRRLDSVGGSIRSIGHSLQSLGTRLSLAVTTPIMALGGAATKTAVEFETALSRIEGLVGESADKVAAYREQVLTLAPQLGRDPAELAKGLEFITSSGLKGAAAVEALTLSGKAATAGMGDTKVVADTVTSAINAYGASNLSTAKTMDVLVATVREGKGEASSFAPVFGQILPLATEMGVTFEEVGGILAFLTKSTGSASIAATGLRGIMSQLIKGTKEGEKAFAAIGTSLDQINREVKTKGLLPTLVDLREKMELKGIRFSEVFSDIEGLNAALQMTGVQAGDAKAVLASVADSAGSLNRAFEAATKTRGFAWAQSMAMMKVQLIELGDIIAPVTNQLLSLSGIALSAWKGLSLEMKTTVVQVAAALATLGPLLIGLGFMVRAIGTPVLWVTGLALKTLGVITLVAETTVSAVVSAVQTATSMVVGGLKVLVGTAVGLAYIVVQSITSVVSSGIATALPVVSSLIVTSFQYTMTAISGLAQAAALALPAVWGFMTATFQAAVNTITGAWIAAMFMMPAATGTLAAVWYAVVDGMAAAWSLGLSVMAALGSTLAVAWGVATATMTAVWTAATSVFNILAGSVAAAWTMVMGWITAANATASSVVTALWTATMTVLGILTSAMGPVWTATLAGMTIAFSAFSAFITATWAAAMTAVPALAAAAAAATPALVVAGVIAGIATVAYLAYNLITGIANKVAGMLAGTIRWVASGVAETASLALGVAKSMGTGIVTVGENTFSALGRTAKRFAASTVSVFSQVWKSTASAFSGAADEVTTAWETITRLVSGGQMEAATTVATSLLKLEWLRTANWLRGLWEDLVAYWTESSGGFSQNIADGFTFVGRAFSALVQLIQTMWPNVVNMIENKLLAAASRMRGALFGDPFGTSEAAAKDYDKAAGVAQGALGAGFTQLAPRMFSARNLSKGLFQPAPGASQEQLAAKKIAEAERAVGEATGADAVKEARKRLDTLINDEWWMQFKVGDAGQKVAAGLTAPIVADAKKAAADVEDALNGINPKKTKLHVGVEGLDAVRADSSRAMGLLLSHQEAIGGKTWGVGQRSAESKRGMGRFEVTGETTSMKGFTEGEGSGVPVIDIKVMTTLLQTLVTLAQNHWQGGSITLEPLSLQEQ